MVTEVGILQLYETPYIVNCIEAFDFNDTAFIVIEVMEKNMTSMLDRFDLLYSEKVIKFVLNETLKGLKFLHNRHIIHRDIKSDNILFNLDGDVKLADFGCSAQLTKEVSKR